MSQDWRLDLLFLIHTQWPNLWGKGENKDLMPRLNWLNVSHLPDMGKNTTAFNPGLHIDESLTSPRPSPQGKNLETSLDAFQIIKEHGDRLWKDGMRFEAG